MNGDDFPNPNHDSRARENSEVVMKFTQIQWHKTEKHLYPSCLEIVIIGLAIVRGDRTPIADRQCLMPLMMGLKLDH